MEDINIFDKEFSPKKHKDYQPLSETIAQIINIHNHGYDQNLWDDIQWDTPLNTLNMDSLDFVEIIMKIEEKMKIEIPDEYWNRCTTPYNIVTVIIDILCTRK